MTKEEFVELIYNLQLINDNLNMYLELGINLYEGTNSVITPADKAIDILLHTIYDTYGIDWIWWFCYENNFGRGDLKAYGTDGTENNFFICETAEELYDYIEQYKIK